MDCNGMEGGMKTDAMDQVDAVALIVLLCVLVWVGICVFNWVLASIGGDA
jgi:hypothetical protein